MMVATLYGGNYIGAYLASGYIALRRNCPQVVPPEQEADFAAWVDGEGKQFGIAVQVDDPPAPAPPEVPPESEPAHEERTDADREEAARCVVDDGMDIEEVARAYGVSASSVRNWIKRFVPQA
jgi:hypothetical protein